MIEKQEIPPAKETLPPPTPYDLRHTYCTDLAKSGVPLVTASKLMGHSNVELTAKIYTHVDQEMTLNAAVQLNAFYLSPGDTSEKLLTVTNCNFDPEKNIVPYDK